MKGGQHGSQTNDSKAEILRLPTDPRYTEKPPIETMPTREQLTEDELHNSKLHNTSLIRHILSGWGYADPKNPIPLNRENYKALAISIYQTMPPKEIFENFLQLKKELFDSPMPHDEKQQQDRIADQKRFLVNVRFFIGDLIEGDINQKKYKLLNEYLTSENPDDVKMKYETQYKVMKESKDADPQELERLLSELSILNSFIEIVQVKPDATPEVRTGMERIKSEAKEVSKYVRKANEEKSKLDATMTLATKKPPIDFETYIHENLAKSISSTSLKEYAKEAAKDLKLRHMYMSLHVDPSEFLNGNYASKQKEKLSPHLMPLIADFENINRMIAEDILTAKSKKHQVNIFNFYVQLLDQCMENNNYFAAFSILSGLNHNAITRLKYLRENSKINKLLEKHEASLALQGSFGEYRKLIQKNQGLHIVPAMNVGFTDLTFIKDGNPDMVERVNANQEVISVTNTEKLILEGRVISDQIPNVYPYLQQELTDSAIQTTIGSRIKPQISDKDLFERSLQVFPRNVKEPFKDHPDVAGKPLRVKEPAVSVASQADNVSATKKQDAQPVSPTPVVTDPSKSVLSSDVPSPAPSPTVKQTVAPTVSQPPIVTQTVAQPIQKQTEKTTLKDMPATDPLVLLLKHLMVNPTIRYVDRKQKQVLETKYDPKKILIGLLVKKTPQDIISALKIAYANLADSEKSKFLNNLRPALEDLIKFDRNLSPGFQAQINELLDSLNIDSPQFQSLKSAVDSAFTAAQANTQQQEKVLTKREASRNWDEFIKVGLKSKKASNAAIVEMAQELYAMQFKLIMDLKPSDFSLEENKTDGLFKIAQAYNKLGDMMQDDILVNATNFEHQKNIIKFYISVIGKALEQHDYATANALYYKLHSPGLIKLWKQVEDEKPVHKLEKNYFRILQETESVISQADNAKKYRDVLKERETDNIPFLPYFGIAQKDIIFTLEGNPSTRLLENNDEILNPSRFDKLGTAVSLLSVVRGKKYPSQPEHSSGLVQRVDQIHLNDEQSANISKRLRKEGLKNFASLSEQTRFMLQESTFAHSQRVIWYKLERAQTSEHMALFAQLSKLYDENKTLFNLDSLLKGPQADHFLIRGFRKPFKDDASLKQQKLPTMGLNKESQKWDNLIDNKESYVKRREMFVQLQQSLEQIAPRPSYYNYLNTHLNEVIENYDFVLRRIQDYEEYKQRIKEFKHYILALMDDVKTPEDLSSAIQNYASRDSGNESSTVALDAFESDAELKAFGVDMTIEEYQSMVKAEFSCQDFRKGLINEMVPDKTSHLSDMDKVNRVKTFVTDHSRLYPEKAQLEGAIKSFPTLESFLAACNVTDNEAKDALIVFYGVPPENSPLFKLFKEGQQFQRKRTGDLYTEKTAAPVASQTDTTQPVVIEVAPPPPPQPSAVQTVRPPAPLTTGAQQPLTHFDVGANVQRINGVLSTITPKVGETAVQWVQVPQSEGFTFRTIFRLTQEQAKTIAEDRHFTAENGMKAKVVGDDAQGYHIEVNGLEALKYIDNVLPTVSVTTAQIEQPKVPQSTVIPAVISAQTEGTIAPDQSIQASAHEKAPKTTFAQVRDYKIGSLLQVADKQTISFQIAGMPANVDVYTRKKSASSHVQKLQKTASVQIDYKAYMDSNDYKNNTKVKDYFKAQREQGKDDTQIINEIVSKLLTSEFDETAYREMFEPLGKYIIRMGDIHITHDAKNNPIPEKQQQTVSLISIPGIDLQHAAVILIDKKPAPNQLDVKQFCKIVDGKVELDPFALEAFQNHYIQIFDRIISTALAQGKKDIVLPALGCGAFLKGLQGKDETKARHLIAMALDQVVQKYEKDIHQIQICAYDDKVLANQIPPVAQQFKDRVRSKKVVVVNRDIVDVARELSEQGRAVCLVNAADARMRMGMYFATPGGHYAVEEIIALKSDAAECQDAGLNPSVLSRISMRKSPQEGDLLRIGEYVSRNALARSVSGSTQVEGKEGQLDVSVEGLFAGTFVMDAKASERMMHSVGKFSYPVQSDLPLQGLSRMPDSGQPPMLHASIAPDQYSSGIERSLEEVDIDGLIKDLPVEHHEKAKTVLKDIKFKVADRLDSLIQSAFSANKLPKVSAKAIDVVRDKYAPQVGAAHVAKVAEQVHGGQPYAVISLSGENLSEVIGFGLNKDSKPKEASSHTVSESKKVILSATTPTVAVYEGHNPNIASHLVVQSDRTFQAEKMKLALYGSDMEMLTRFYNDNVVAAKRPIVVNCTDGVDRTGIVLLAMTMLHEFTNGNDFTKLSDQEQKEHIIGILAKMRSQEGRGPFFLSQTHDVARGVVLGYGLIAAQRQLAFQIEQEKKITHPILKQIIMEKNQDPADSLAKIKGIIDTLTGDNKRIAEEYVSLLNERINIDAQFLLASSETSEFTKNLGTKEETQTKPFVEIDSKTLHELETQGFDVTPHAKKVLPEIIAKFNNNPNHENLQLVQAILFRNGKPRFDAGALPLKAEDKLVVMAAQLLQARETAPGLIGEATRRIKKATQYTGKGPGMSELKAQMAALSFEEVQAMRERLSAMQTDDPKINRIYGYMLQALPTDKQVQTARVDVPTLPEGWHEWGIEEMQTFALDFAANPTANKLDMISQIFKEGTGHQPSNLAFALHNEGLLEIVNQARALLEARENQSPSLKSITKHTGMGPGMKKLKEDLRKLHSTTRDDMRARLKTLHTNDPKLGRIFGYIQDALPKQSKKAEVAAETAQRERNAELEKARGLDTNKPMINAIRKQFDDPENIQKFMKFYNVDEREAKRIIEGMREVVVAQVPSSPTNAYMLMSMHGILQGTKSMHLMEPGSSYAIYEDFIRHCISSAIDQVDNNFDINYKAHLDADAVAQLQKGKPSSNWERRTAPLQDSISTTLSQVTPTTTLPTKALSIPAADIQKVKNGLDNLTYRPRDLHRISWLAEPKTGDAQFFVTQQSLSDADAKKLMADPGLMNTFKAMNARIVKSSDGSDNLYRIEVSAPLALDYVNKAIAALRSSSPIKPATNLPPPVSHAHVLSAAMSSDQIAVIRILNGMQKGVWHFNHGAYSSPLMSHEEANAIVKKYHKQGLSSVTIQDLTGNPPKSQVVMSNADAIYAAYFSQLEQKTGLTGWSVATDKSGNSADMVSSPEMTAEQVKDMEKALRSMGITQYHAFSDTIFIPTGSLAKALLSTTLPPAPVIKQPVTEQTFLENPTLANLNGIVNPQNPLIKCLMMIKDIKAANNEEWMAHPKVQEVRALLDHLNVAENVTFLSDYQALSKKAPSGDMNRLLAGINNIISTQSKKVAQHHTEYAAMPTVKRPLPAPKVTDLSILQHMKQLTPNKEWRMDTIEGEPIVLSPRMNGDAVRELVKILKENDITSSLPLREKDLNRDDWHIAISRDDAEKILKTPGLMAKIKGSPYGQIQINPPGPSPIAPQQTPSPSTRVPPVTTAQQETLYPPSVKGLVEDIMTRIQIVNFKTDDIYMDAISRRALVSDGNFPMGLKNRLLSLNVPSESKDVRHFLENLLTVLPKEKNEDFYKKCIMPAIAKQYDKHSDKGVKVFMEAQEAVKLQTENKKTLK